MRKSGPNPMVSYADSRPRFLEFRATVVSNLYCEAAPPPIGENSVVKHHTEVNGSCTYFYVLLRNISYTSEAAGEEMALPGGCPVKRSFIII